MLLPGVSCDAEVFGCLHHLERVAAHSDYRWRCCRRRGVEMHDDRLFVVEGLLIASHPLFHFVKYGLEAAVVWAGVIDGEAHC